MFGLKVITKDGNDCIKMELLEHKKLQNAEAAAIYI